MFLDELSVLVLIAGEVDTRLTRVGDDHADIADLDHRFRNHLDGGKQPIDVIRALNERLQLTATQATCQQELLRILKVVVIGLRRRGNVANRWRDDLSIGQRRAVMHCHDADGVGGVLDDDRLEPPRSPMSAAIRLNVGFRRIEGKERMRSFVITTNCAVLNA